MMYVVAKKRTTMWLGISTFIGAAIATAFVGTTYPVVIWGVGFGVAYKLTHSTEPKQVHACPLAEYAAALQMDGVMESVVAQNPWEFCKSQSTGCDGAIEPARPVRHREFSVRRVM